MIRHVRISCGGFIGGRCRRAEEAIMVEDRRQQPERRKEQRHRTLKAGHIAFKRAGTIDCRVRNMSQIGACLDVTSVVGVPDEFTLLIEYDHFKRRCRVIWRNTKQLGVEFIAEAVVAEIGDQPMAVEKASA
jgi:hypothetical protein